jgi:hypothetical protein
MVHVEARLRYAANSRYRRLLEVKAFICKSSTDMAGFVCGPEANSAAPVVHFAAFAAYGLSA